MVRERAAFRLCASLPIQTRWWLRARAPPPGPAWAHASEASRPVRFFGVRPVVGMKIPQLSTAAPAGARVNPPPQRTERLLRLREVQARTGLGRSTIYLRISQGRFPAPIPLGSPHIVAWIEGEIQAWIEHQIAAARRQPDHATHLARA